MVLKFLNLKTELKNFFKLNKYFYVFNQVHFQIMPKGLRLKESIIFEELIKLYKPLILP